MNTNCLAGIQCPECKSKGPFWITVKTTVLMSDDGWSETSGDSDDWGSWSYIRCDECDEVAIVSEFKSTPD